MTKRLQVLFEDSEYGEIRKMARAQRMTVAEWVRGALRLALRSGTSEDPIRKLEAVRSALCHEFPTGEIETMLAEIERGYLEGGREG